MIEVRIPTSNPRGWSVAVVGGAAFLIGLMIAAWGMTNERPTQRTEDPDWEAELGAASLLSDGGLYDAEIRAENPRGDAAVEVTASDAASETEEAPADAVIEEANEVAPTPSTATPGSATPTAPGEVLHTVSRIRIAYLRCDVGSGPVCPRDEVLEAAIWQAIENLPQCVTAPRAAGSADLRVAYARGEAPALDWRDTFGPEVVRLDRAAVLRCLTPTIRATAPSTDVEQLVLSFRFSAE